MTFKKYINLKFIGVGILVWLLFHIDLGQVLGILLESDLAIVALSLGFIGPAAVEAVPALTQALDDEDWEVRETAALALNMIGPPAVKAVPALIQALADENDKVRTSAAWALQSITGQNLGQDPTLWQQWWEAQQ